MHNVLAVFQVISSRLGLFCVSSIAEVDAGEDFSALGSRLSVKIDIVEPASSSSILALFRCIFAMFQHRNVNLQCDSVSELEILHVFIVVANRQDVPVLLPFDLLRRHG